MARAVTLVELLMAVCLISLVVLSVGTLYTVATGFFNTFSAQSKMQNDANFALQHMVRHICLAEDVEILNSSGLPATSGPRVRVTKQNGTTYEYWQEGSDVKYNGGVIEEIIASKVNELNFSGYDFNPKSQRITLTVELTMEGKESINLHPLSFITRVTLRRYE
jgi:type II secretory pathway pseudopilin PulG